MIIGKILGGLGNQMFQYAATRSLSIRKGVPFCLDVKQFSGYKLHQGFEINTIFDCNSHLANKDDISNVLGWQSRSIFRKLLSYPAMSGFRSTSWIQEPYFKFWNGFFDLPSSCYLDGYWQSEKYFESVQDLIRNDFCFRLPMNQQNALIANKIENSRAISLHVRRGDYIANPNANEIHGVCSVEYYRMAMEQMAAQIESPRFFVFSDDMEWVRQNLDIEYQHELVDHNKGSESYNDMRLMSMCQHHIVANSTFSWWGAWLNPRREKVVIAPKKWFARRDDADDLIPSSWITL
jgi:hypothetical protein